MTLMSSTSNMNCGNELCVGHSRLIQHFSVICYMYYALKHRYYGEDAPSEQSAHLSEKKAHDILERIHQQARKRRTLSVEHQGIKSDDTAAQSTPKRKAKRNSSCSQDGASLDETQQKRKKRKKLTSGKECVEGGFEDSFREGNSAKNNEKTPKGKQKMERKKEEQNAAESDIDDSVEMDGELVQSIGTDSMDPELESQLEDRVGGFTILGDVQRKQAPKVGVGN